jgi:hypothetical protein
MTSEQKAKVLALEQKIQPKIPFYITAMYKKSLASGILVSRCSCVHAFKIFSLVLHV